ncbi:hypothetical protein Tcan_17675 [Toxocara canis]|uniref:Uncharacterized protein n=1 Tax=Toxocara canis TaxID=6265 RepID=A0A0B2V162_TOXCA|nr:hypothetical protein Tcan_17675 [Toxocara canis]
MSTEKCIQREILTQSAKLSALVLHDHAKQCLTTWVRYGCADNTCNALHVRFSSNDVGHITIRTSPFTDPLPSLVKALRLGWATKTCGDNSPSLLYGNLTGCPRVQHNCI